MELLLLDTTEKEGEDNELYHVCSDPSSVTRSAWRGLRRVLAAAVGTTASVCGEALQTAHFATSATDVGVEDGGDAGVVGFVDLSEVLYVLAFPASANVPLSVVQFFTRSSCDLLLSLFGYPDAKLSEWRRGDAKEERVLKKRLDAFFASVFAIIRQDLAGDTHLQFAFGGRVPATNFPLETLMTLAATKALDLRGDATDATLRKAAVAGRCIRYRETVSTSTIRPDLLRLINQWLLHPRGLSAQASFASATALEGWKASTFELHDVRFARRGFYPKRHTLLLLERGDLQLVYLILKDLSHLDVDKPIGRALVGCLDVQALNQLFETATLRLGTYLDVARTSRRAFSQVMQERQSKPWFLRCVVVLDLLRDVLLGESFHDACRDIDRQLGDDAAAAAAAEEAHAAVFSLFVDRIAAFQQMSPWDATPTAATSSSSKDDPDLPTWVAPVQLDVDDPNTLFLHEANAESGADISSEDTHVFPPPGETLFSATKPTIERMESRLVHQDAESHAVSTPDGGSQRLWIVANYYETMHLFAVFDADLVTLEAVEQHMDCVCAFGGYSSSYSSCSSRGA